MALLLSRNVLRTTDYGLWTTNFHSINYADNRGVDRTLFAAESHSGRAALHDQDNFVDAGANRVDGDDVTFLIRAIHVHQPRDEQLAPVKAVVLARSHYCSNYSSKNHNQWSVVSGQWSK